MDSGSVLIRRRSGPGPPSPGFHVGLHYHLGSLSGPVTQMAKLTNGTTTHPLFVLLFNQ